MQNIFDILNRFDATHDCEEQTDGRTDVQMDTGQTLS